MHRPTFEADDYEDRLRSLAAEGKTCTGAATALGINYKATKRMADELGIVFAWSRGRGTGHETPLTRWQRQLQKMTERDLALDPVARWA